MAHECTVLALGSLAHQCTELRVGKQRGKSRKSKREGEYRIKSMTTSKSTWCAVYSVGVWEEEGGVSPFIVSLGDLYPMLKY